MAQRGALETVRRMDISKETGGVRGSATGYLNVSAYENVTVMAEQENLPDAGPLDSNKDPRPSQPGPKTCGLNFSFKLTEDTYAQYGALFEAALGSEVAASSLTANLGGTQNATTGTISAGTPSPWVKVTYDSGVPDYLPVQAYNATTITYAIQSRIGARAVTDIQNPSECSGGCFQQEEAADLISLRAEVDRASEPDALSYLLQGMVPTRLALNMPLNERATFEVELMGCDWSGPSYSTSNVGDMPDWSDEFNGWNVELSIYDPSTPAAFSNEGLVAIENLNLAPTWTPNERAIGRTSTGTVPGPAVNGVRQGVHFSEDLLITFDTIDTDWFTRRGAGTVIGIAIVIYNKAAGATPDKAFCVNLPACVVNALPVETPVNGVMGHQAPLKVRKSTVIASAHRSKCAVAFFNS